MQFGLALPQYDYSVSGEDPLSWKSLSEIARHAEALGFDSLWLSDHLHLDLAKYNGPDRAFGSFEPLVTLAGLTQQTSRIQLGTLVLCEALRHPGMLAKSIATLSRLAPGRIAAGLGAGWYGPDYEAIGMKIPTPGERIIRLSEATQTIQSLLAGEPVTFHGEFYQLEEASLMPAPSQKPPVFLGGKGDRFLGVVANYADGWNMAWNPSPSVYAQRLDVLGRACETVNRDSKEIQKSVGLYALAGSSESDVQSRFDQLTEHSPKGTLDGVKFGDWRVGKLVGTPSEISEQVEMWETLGVSEIICNLGGVPFSFAGLDDLEALAAALPAKSKAAASDR